ncbi:hypothetical protein ABT120_39980 [Nonomuraea angiospora]|uniref:hypothetical protein n=1 Tax=Nonomuraea angiospora TaxID=46172 RepID=UPI00331EE092
MTKTPTLTAGVWGIELMRNFSHERTTWSGDGYRQATGLEVDSLGDAVRARGVRRKFPFLTCHAEPDDEEWDFGDEAEFVRRLPRLARHYGLTR